VVLLCGKQIGVTTAPDIWEPVSKKPASEMQETQRLPPMALLEQKSHGRKVAFELRVLNTYSGRGGEKRKAIIGKIRKGLYQKSHSGELRAGGMAKKMPDNERGRTGETKRPSEQRLYQNAPETQ